MTPRVTFKEIVNLSKRHSTARLSKLSGLSDRQIRSLKSGRQQNPKLDTFNAFYLAVVDMEKELTYDIKQ